MEEDNNLSVRKKIYNLISDKPGINISKISKILCLKTSHTIYHLNYLSKLDLVSIEKEKGYTRCFVKGEISSRDKVVLSVLRRKYPLKIVLFLLENPYSKHSDIFEHFNIAKSTLTYHLKKLLTKDIISFEVVDKKVVYFVYNNNEIIALLIKYKPSKIVTNVEKTWADFSVRYKKK